MNALDIDATALHFGTPFIQRNGQKIVPMSFDSNRFEYENRLRVQLGTDQDNMLATEYGVNTPLEGSDPNRRNLDVFPTPELEERLRALDNHIARVASERSMDFFKTPTLNKQYMPIVRTNKQGQTIVRVKVNCGPDRATEVRVLKDNKSYVKTFESVTRGSMLLAVVDTPGIWSNPTQFGIMFTARGILVRPPAPTNGLNMFSLKPGITEAVDTDNYEALVEDSMMDD